MQARRDEWTSEKCGHCLILDVLVPIELSTLDVHNSRYTRYVHELQCTSPRVGLTFKALVLRIGGRNEVPRYVAKVTTLVNIRNTRLRGAY